MKKLREKRKRGRKVGFLTSGSQPKNPRNSKAELKRFGGESRVHGFFWMGGGKLSNLLHDLEMWENPSQWYNQ